MQVSPVGALCLGRRLASTGGAATSCRPPNGESKWRERKKREARRGANEVFRTPAIVVVAHYAGLTVAQMTDPAGADARRRARA